MGLSGDAVLAVLGTLSGTALGLLGSLLVWRLGRNERDQQWRRDQQIAAYSELVAANIEVGLAYTLASGAETDDEYAEASRAIAASVIRFHNATHRARIVASGPVLPLVDELHRLTTEATNELRKLKAERNERAADHNLETAVGVREAISEQAREDFKFGRNRWLRVRRNIRAAGPALSTDSEAR